jgi:hypothetical protein
MRANGAKIVSAMLAMALTAAALVAASALASTHPKHRQHHAPRTGLRVFTRHRRVARISSAGAKEAPAGAILAAVSGKTEVYVTQNSSGEYCLYHFTVGAEGGGGCEEASPVETEGSVGIFQEGAGATAPNSPATLRVTALVPNSVSSVKFTDRDGTSYSIPVTNNVVSHEDIDLASVSFELGDGKTQTTDVAAVVDRTPRQPGAPGSSR